MRIRFPRNVSHLRTASTLLQRAIAVVLLLGLLLGIAGVPVITVAKKDRSRPYPCQNRPCGCASADECWHHCCCLNNRQKVAWARENGVTPPDFVIAAAEREQAEAVAAGDNDEHGTHALALPARLARATAKSPPAASSGIIITTSPRPITPGPITSRKRATCRSRPTTRPQ